MSISVNENRLPAVLNTLQETLDDKIGQGVFVPIMEKMLENCNVTGWEQEENHYRLTLEQPIKATHPESGRKVFYLEKEVLLGILPSKMTIYFPKVRNLHLKIKSNEVSRLDGTDKKLSTIWAEQKVAFITYTAAVYSMRWDPSESKVKVNSIDDSWAHGGKLQTEILTLDQSIKRWSSRNFAATEI